VTTSIAGFAIPAGNDFPTLGITVTPGSYVIEHGAE
jgi:hypothetical protein